MLTMAAIYSSGRPLQYELLLYPSLKLNNPMEIQDEQQHTQ
jgi:hypothetical protein